MQIIIIMILYNRKKIKIFNNNNKVMKNRKYKKENYKMIKIKNMF